MMRSRILFLLIFFLLNEIAFSYPNDRTVFYLLIDQLPHDTSISKINIYNCYGRDSDLTQIIKYDSRGRLSLSFRMDISGKKVMEKTEFKYQGNSGKVISRENQLFSNSINQYFSMLSEYYGYDSLNRLISKYSFDKDTSYIDVEEYQYNSDNKIFKTTLQRMQGTKYVKEIRFYDNLKRLIKTDTYNALKEIIYSDIIQYDGSKRSHYLKNKEGIILKDVNEYRTNLISKTTVYKVEENGNPVQDHEVQFFYNDKGWLTGEEVRREDELETRVSLNYIYK